MLKRIANIFFVCMGILFCLIIITAKVTGKHHWNKDTGVDVHQEFTTAYVDFGNHEVRKLKIVSWRDFDDSDQLQFTDVDGRTYLTGCNRCVLVEEQCK